MNELENKKELEKMIMNLSREIADASGKKCDMYEQRATLKMLLAVYTALCSNVQNEEN